MRTRQANRGGQIKSGRALLRLSSPGAARLVFSIAIAAVLLAALGCGRSVTSSSYKRRLDWGDHPSPYSVGAYDDIYPPGSPGRSVTWNLPRVKQMTDPNEDRADK